MREAPTQQDVAKLAGVSPRTVSRVFSEEKGYSAATRERVLVAVEQIKYRPNRAARALATGQGSSIGVVGGSLADPLFAELAAAIGSELTTQGKTMLLATHESDRHRQQEALEMLQSDAAHGVILLPAPNDLVEVANLVQAGLRVVLIDPSDKTLNIPAVCSSIDKGICRAISYLVACGRRSIVRLANRDVLSGRLTQHHWPIEYVAPTMNGAYVATQRLLRERPDVDAIFADSDMMAIGVLHALHHAGRSVPGDVAVVGYGDLRIALQTTPSLTTVHVDRAAIAAAAVALTLGPRTVYAKTIEVDTQLILRESA